MPPALGGAHVVAMAAGRQDIARRRFVQAGPPGGGDEHVDQRMRVLELARSLVDSSIPEDDLFAGIREKVVR